MLKLVERVEGLAGEATALLCLPFDLRQKSRFRATLTDGREVGVFLERGRILRGGDVLRAESGALVVVEAADEAVSTVRTDDARQFARVCYHLGNRHVPLQIGDGFARYRHDHVLDAMVAGLGLQAFCEQQPFEPEAGAYGGGYSHAHAHDSGHAHVHPHGA